MALQRNIQIDLYFKKTRIRTGNCGFKQFTNQVRVMNLIQVYIRHSTLVVLNYYTLKTEKIQTDTCTPRKAQVSGFNCVCCVFLLCFSVQSKEPESLDVLYYTTCAQIVAQITPLCCNFYGQFFLFFFLFLTNSEKQTHMFQTKPEHRAPSFKMAELITLICHICQTRSMPVTLSSLLYHMGFCVSLNWKAKCKVVRQTTGSCFEKATARVKHTVL